MTIGEQDIGPAFSAEALVRTLGKGRRLDDDVADALEKLVGVQVGQEGLSRLFQPGFPGIRIFATEARVAAHQSVELTLVGIARDGAPAWWGERGIVRGRNGGIELHLGAEEIEPAYRSRNITVDLIQREVDILSLLREDSGSRITIDAHGISSYISAIHGFVFADETEEGPPVLSTRALEPAGALEGDRAAWMRAAPAMIERIADRLGLGRDSIDGALRQLERARSPWDFARLTLPGSPKLIADGDDGEIGVGALGRELLLSREMPPWRAALYIAGSHPEARATGEEYRRRKSMRSEQRLARELHEARELIRTPKRDARIRGLKLIGMIGPAWMTPEVKALEDDRDRRVAAVARQTLRELTGLDLPHRLLEFAESAKNDGHARALAYRVLAEHFKNRLTNKVSLLRVHPDARIQRAIVPKVADDPTDAGPNLASLLAANPAHEGESARPGLGRLRLELIHRLTRLVDPRTLPALLAAYRAEPPPEPTEMLALSRALVAFVDPRAQLALAEVARRLDRPAFP